MAQLSDDCFAFGGALLPVSEMERLIAERVMPVKETETVPLAAARGRVVAQDVLAPIDLPPFDNSAVDGFAVRHADLASAGDTRLKVVDRITAGRAATRALGAGEAVRIFTGAPMPGGADTVFMQEDTRVESDTVIVPPGLKRGANSRAAGEDLRAQSIMLPAGRRLTTAHVALGGVGTRPWRARETEALLQGQPPTREAALGAARAAFANARPGKLNAFKIELGARTIADAVVIAAERNA